MIKLFEKQIFKFVPLLTFLIIALNHLLNNNINRTISLTEILVFIVLIVLNILVILANYDREKVTNRYKFILLFVFLSISLIIFLFQYYKY